MIELTKSSIKCWQRCSYNLKIEVGPNLYVYVFGMSFYMIISGTNKSVKYFLLCFNLLFINLMPSNRRNSCVCVYVCVRVRVCVCVCLWHCQRHTHTFRQKSGSRRRPTDPSVDAGVVIPDSDSFIWLDVALMAYVTPGPNFVKTLAAHAFSLKMCE